eukprot:EG_transcript_2187
MVLTALQFSVQSIFSLHFVSMCGMRFSVPWGFDIGLTLVSLTIVVLFGTSAITLTLVLRHRLEPAIRLHFEQEADCASLSFYMRLLRFILCRVPFSKLLLAVILMVFGAAGCHHLGMWSIHGLQGSQITSQLTFWSFLTTVGLGGTVCVVAILAFLLVPEGIAAILTACVLAGGIAAFHFSSAIWGMHYIEGVEGVTTNVVIGEEAIILFVVAQGAISQLVTAVFSRMALRQHATMAQQLAVAQTLGQHIAAMDLEPAKAMQLEAENPSMLEQTLFHIVNNLLLYRPYLPDTLFASQGEDKDSKQAEKHEDCDDAMSEGSAGPRSRHRSSTSSAGNAGYPRSSSGLPDSLGPHPSTRRHASRTSTDDAMDHSLRAGRKERKLSTARRAGNLAVGLRASHLSILRIRLQKLDFEGGKGMGAEGQLTRFMEVATTQIKAFGGTIVMCAGGGVVAFWPLMSPDVAIETAMAIQLKCDMDLVQVVQSALFLSGNLATEHLRCFNVVGPLDWAGQQLLRAGAGGRHIFITSDEWQRVRFKFKCLPYEQIIMGGRDATLYTVLLPPHGAGDVVSKEWMYEVEGNLRSTQSEQLDRCWLAYTQGDYATAMHLAAALRDVPPWYCQHLVAIATQAASYQVNRPTKSLDALGWPSKAPGGPPHEDILLLSDV